MSSRVLKLFLVISDQINRQDHPLNMIAQKFVSIYVKGYNEKIRQNEEMFHKTKMQEFHVQNILK